MFVRLIIGSAVYTTTIAVVHWLGCEAGLYVCRFGREITFSSAVLPFLILGSLLLAIGVVVAWIVDAVSAKIGYRGRLALAGHISVGLLVGVLPVVVWDVYTLFAHHRSEEIVITVPKYLPWFFAGGVTAFVLLVLRPNTKK